MCAPAVIPIVASALAIAGGVYLSEEKKQEKQDKMMTPDPEKLAQQERKAESIRNQDAQRPVRANAADALYGNPERMMGTSQAPSSAGAASTGLTAAPAAKPSALSLSNTSLLGQ